MKSPALDIWAGSEDGPPSHLWRADSRNQHNSATISASRYSASATLHAIPWSPRTPSPGAARSRQWPAHPLKVVLHFYLGTWQCHIVMPSVQTYIKTPIFIANPLTFNYLTYHSKIFHIHKVLYLCTFHNLLGSVSIKLVTTPLLVHHLVSPQEVKCLTTILYPFLTLYNFITF